jgi:hypothetical protein
MPVVEPYFVRLLKVLAARPRRHVLFCGTVFGRLLQEYVVDTHTFNLRQNDGVLEQMASSFANVRIKCDSGYVAGGWCRSWARQGIPMSTYAEEVRQRYKG